MDIGIIGSGNIGACLARKLSALGHRVSVANSRGPASLAALAEETGVAPVTVEEAARAEDIVIVAIPEVSVLGLPEDLFANTPERAIVVDTGNYYPEIRDGQIAEIDAGLTDSEWVSRRLRRPVIKAFNNIPTWSLANRGLPAGSPGRVCLSVAGDSARDKAVILHLLDQLGFDGLDAGTLAESWRQQPGTPAYCHDLEIDALRAALAAAEASQIAAYRRKGEEDARRLIAAAGGSVAAAGAGSERA